MSARVHALGVARVGLVVTAVPGRMARSWNVGFVDAPSVLDPAQPALSDDGLRTEA